MNLIAAGHKPDEQETQHTKDKFTPEILDAGRCQVDEQVEHFPLSMDNKQARVGIIMGSQSDWPTLEHAARTLSDFGVAWESRVVSAHRTPQLLYDYAQSAAGRGIQCIIAGAGGAAHLPGMASAITTVPVLGVPVKSRTLNGVDSLLSIVQMPAGIPTATFAIGDAGAVNAGLFAVSMLAATGDQDLAEKLTKFRESQREKIESGTLPQMEDLHSE